jgi:hypothetical protein
MRRTKMIDIKKEMAEIDELYRGDREVWDSMSANLLTEVLRSLGYTELVEWFDKPPSWGGE